jgi:hypothetical protein
MKSPSMQKMNPKFTPLVDFLIVGAAKSGTSTLFEYLTKHDQISACQNKEPAYFLPHGHIKRQTHSSEAYQKLFSKQSGQLAFEASVNYTYDYSINDQICKNILAHNPKMKIIYIVRNPVERILSGHRFMYKNGTIPKKIRGINNNLAHSDYQVKISCYYSQIRPYIEAFGKENIHILFLEDLKIDPLSAVNGILKFLNINPYNQLPENLGAINSSKRLLVPADRRIIYKLRFIKKILPVSLFTKMKEVVGYLIERKLSQKDLILNATQKRKLSDVLLPEIEQLQSYTGKNLEDWKKTLQH